MTSFSLLAMESRLHGIPCFFAIIHVLPMSSLPSLRLSNPLIWPLCLNKKLAMKEDLTADIAYQFVTKKHLGRKPLSYRLPAKKCKEGIAEVTGLQMWQFALQKCHWTLQKYREKLYGQTTSFHVW